MNRSTETTAPDNTARIARLAWFCAFVLPLVLAALLLGVRSAQAAPLAPAVVPFALEDEEDLAFDEEGEEVEAEVEDEFAEAECEIAGEEAAEGEITQAEADALCREAEEFVEAGRSTATPCPIRTARAHLSMHRRQLKLTIGYTTNKPVNVTIQVRKFGSFKRHLSRSGVLRFTKRLKGKHSSKHVVVRIKLPRGSAGCPSRRLVLFPR